MHACFVEHTYQWFRLAWQHGAQKLTVLALIHRIIVSTFVEMNMS